MAGPSTAFVTQDAVHVRFMRLALEQAAKAVPTLTAFCVGCIIVDRSSTAVLATGFSRELDGNTHAEANAIDKLSASSAAAAVAATSEERLDLYSTLEPCSIRTSGNIPCTTRIIESGKVGRVFVGVEEPADFVLCEGIELLRKVGVEVWIVAGFNEACLLAARRGHERTDSVQ